jgi:serine/threonine-protein kinase
LVAGRYRVIRRLASGGMGEVVLASQEGPAGFDKVVALKRILPGLNRDEVGVQLFLDEARLVARLTHRNIAQITDLGRDEDGFYVAMEYVHGSSVRALVDKLRSEGRVLPPHHAVDIAAQLAEALAYAYSAPGRGGQPLCIIHRDVTPHNILLSTAGDVKLIDFGVAKSTAQEHLTEAGMVKGKMAYLSPEQSRGAVLDSRSDLFSLGIVLHEMLTGSNPFVREGALQTVMAIRGETPRSVAEVEPALAAVAPVLERLLAKSPDDRFADAALAAEALAELRQQLPKPQARLGAFISEALVAELGPAPHTLSFTAPSPPERAGDATVMDSVPAAPPATVLMAAPPEQPVREPVAPLPAQVAAAPAAPAGRRAAFGFIGVVVAVVAVVVAISSESGPTAQPAAATPVEPRPVVAAIVPPPVVVAPRPEPLAEPKLEPVPVAKVETAPEPKREPVAVAKLEPRPAPIPAAKIEPKIDPVPRRLQPESRAAAPAWIASVSGALGAQEVALDGPTGHATLTPGAAFQLELEWHCAVEGCSGTLSSAPWAIVYLDGTSLGKTPVALPAAARWRLEFQHPGLDHASVILSVQPAR